MRQLQYAEDAVKKGFTGFQWQHAFNDNFANDSRKSVQEQIDFVFGLANNCRGNNVPEFSNEKKYLPVKELSPVTQVEAIVSVQPVELKSEQDLKSSKELTEPPKQTKQDDLLNAILIGLGVVVVLKILS